MLSAVTEWGVTGRAVARGQVEVHAINPRDFTTDRHRTVDSRPYGGGPGMIMLAPPLAAAVQGAQAWLQERGGGPGTVIYLSPQGQTLDQAGVESLGLQGDLILIAGRYEGIDERFVDAHVDLEVSIGDYVLSGGELPAMVLVDALVRRLPEVLGHSESAAQDSFANGLLDCPHYTRPEVYAGRAVPEVLRSGDHAKIAAWRLEQSTLRTAERRPDLLARRTADTEVTRQPK